MPDRLSVGERDPSGSAPYDRAPSGWASRVGQVLGVLAVLLLLAAAGGWLWHAWWDAPMGITADGRWLPFPYEAGNRADFSATAAYVVVALPTGLLGGLLAAFLFDREELVTLGAVLVGSVLAAVLMAQVGAWLGPEDPALLATEVPDGTTLPGSLRVSGTSPHAVLPLGATTALMAVYLLTPGRRRPAPRPGSLP